MENRNYMRVQLERLEHDRLISSRPAGEEDRVRMVLKLDDVQTDDLQLTAAQFEKIKSVLLGEDE